MEKDVKHLKHSTPNLLGITDVNYVRGQHSSHSSKPRRRLQIQVMDTAEKFSHTFDHPGTYAYYCSLHLKMTGKIIVQ
jgi:plastocyanin